MKILPRPPSGLCFLLLWTTAAVWAGPLDRNDAGPRYNPSTVNMLRVPGVVGLDYRTALATLQQAGLNPRIHFIRSPQKRYRGRVGEVVKQLPASGGMAMLGASVSLQVYTPGNQTSSSPADQAPTTPEPDYGQSPNSYQPPANGYGVPASDYGAMANDYGSPASDNPPATGRGSQQTPPPWQSGNGNGGPSTQPTNPNPDPLWQPSPPPTGSTSAVAGPRPPSPPGAGFPNP